MLSSHRRSRIKTIGNVLIGLSIVVVAGCSSAVDTTSEESVVRQAAGAREGSFATEIQGCVQTDANEALTLSFVNNVAANGNGPFTIPNNVNGICGINGEILRMRVNDPSGARLFTISVGNPEIGYPWASVKYQPCNCESVHNFSESETFTFTFANSAYQVRVHRDVDSSRKNMYVAILQT